MENTIDPFADETDYPPLDIDSRQDIKCPVMANTEVTAKWCYNNQHVSFCGKCPRQDKPAMVISFYQVKKRKVSA